MGKNRRAIVISLIVIWLFLIGKTVYQQVGINPQEFQALRRYHPGTKEYAEDRLAHLPQEFHLFWGRSLDEKRDLTTWEDLYRFLMWCKGKLPKSVDVGLYFSNSLYPHKAAYYLYPHNWRGDDVLLIFGQEISLDSQIVARQTQQDTQIHLKKDFSLGQTFRTGESTRSITSIDLVLNKAEWGSHEVLTLSIWESFEKNRKIGSKSLSGAEISPGTDQQKFIFDFPLEVKPRTQYYLELTHEGDSDSFVGGVALSYRNPYPAGIFFNNGVPEKDKDLWFIVRGKDHNYTVIAHYGEDKNIAIKNSYLRKIMRDPVESERWQSVLKSYLE